MSYLQEKRYVVTCETSFTYVFGKDEEEARQNALKDFAYLGYTKEDAASFGVEEVGVEEVTE